MKTTLKFLLLSTLALLKITATCQENQNFTLTEEKFKIEFSTKWTIQDLAEAKKELSQNAINLHFELLEFNSNGSLKKINASIEYSDGMKATFESRELTEEPGPGFRRDFIKHPLTHKE